LSLIDKVARNVDLKIIIAKMKIAIYGRVSTNDQTPENQIIRLTEFAREKGWNYEVYTEVESTRKTRPVKAELLHKLRSGEYDGVMVYKLDRWARSSTELILDISELVKKEVVFISYTENLDFSTSTGRLHFQILSAFAEFERDLISERTKEGIRRAKMRGKTLGRPPGSKDKKKRRRAGYYLREARKKQQEDQKNGEFRPIEDYLDRNRS
jgi:putative DNA-invertase from lambdoid prophage Rac